MDGRYSRQSGNGDIAYTKTKMCKFFALGRCARGSACTFAHRAEELRPQLDLSKTRPCRYFLSRGFCQNGLDCRFAHGDGELRGKPAEDEGEFPLRAPAMPTPTSSRVSPSISSANIFQSKSQVIKKAKGATIQIPSSQTTSTRFNVEPVAGESEKEDKASYCDATIPVDLKVPLREGHAQNTSADISSISSNSSFTNKQRACWIVTLGREKAEVYIKNTFIEIAACTSKPSRCASSPNLGSVTVAHI